MADSVRVNLHCHSSLSDGQPPPAELARRLAKDGVRYAALTDHDTLDGLAEFREAAAREGIGAISGVEILARLGDREIHLLGYGFDPANDELRQALGTARNGGQRPAGAADAYRGPRRGLPAADACRLVHAAGGKVFLAHPLDYERDEERLGELVSRLEAVGLDGLEAYYGPYDANDVERLVELADQRGLVVSGGSDFHGPDVPRLSGTSVELPRARWVAFRDALFAAANRRSLIPPPERAVRAKPPSGLDLPSFFVRILLPTLLAIGLLVVPLFWFIVPAFEDALLSRKRETIRELTNSAISILAEYHAEERAGRLTRGQAQEAAVARVRDLRYGKDGKDYFWITDMHPRMVVHPYRTDLNGKDVSDFRDPQGNRVFMEFARAVREHQEGYVEYVWQWKDDPQRLAPKQSYVKGFAPWGWVIGTGLYMDDVRSEIAAITGRIIHVSAALAVVIALLLAFVAQQSFRSERKRSLAEEALRESHERYRALVEASKEGTLLVVDGRFTYANQTLLALLGYSESDLPLLDLVDVLPDAAHLAAVAPGETAAAARAKLVRRDGTHVEAMLAAEQIELGDHKGIAFIVRDIKGPRREPDTSPSATHREPPPLALLEQAESFMRPLPSCELSESIGHAASIMSRSDASALLVTDSAGRGVGLVTDSDLRERVLGRGLPASRPVSEVMTAPLVAVSPSALAYEAMLLMRDDGLEHVAVRDELGRVLGVVRSRELLELDRYPLAALASAIRNAARREDLLDFRPRLLEAVRSLVEAGARPKNTCRAITAVTDAFTERLVHFAVDDLGPPLVPFAFVALGSQGREDQTLVTDQDNAIIHGLPAPEHRAAVKEYFAALGASVCTWLDRLGYPLCKGLTMANQERWCAPLDTWKEYFSSWVSAAEPKDLLGFNTFFDFRCVYGEQALATALRRQVLAELGRTNTFFVHLAKDALPQKPLLDFFGNIVARAGAESSERSFDIKEAVSPIVAFARLYALRHGDSSTNTFDRLEHLREGGVLSPDAHAEVFRAYDLLVGLRLRQQAAALAEGREPSNHVPLSSLTQIDQVMLKQVFSQTASLQKRIAFDFLGGAWTQGI
jgi:PAS domain S-box-containing protein